MDATAHYRQLAQRGRAAFLAAVARAVLLRPRGSGTTDFDGLAATGTYDQPAGLRRGEIPGGDDVLGDALGEALGEAEILPLVKKPGAPFGDRVTVGRTGND